MLTLKDFAAKFVIGVWNIVSIAIDIFKEIIDILDSLKTI